MKFSTKIATKMVTKFEENKSAQHKCFASLVQAVIVVNLY